MKIKDRLNISPTCWLHRGYAARRALQATLKTAATEYAQHPEITKNITVVTGLKISQRNTVDTDKRKPF